MKKLLVMASVYGESEDIQGLFTTLVAQTLKPDRFILIDDGTPNFNVEIAFMRSRLTFLELNAEYFRMPTKDEPNKDTIGIGLKEAFNSLGNIHEYEYVSILDADSRLDEKYYETIIQLMDSNPKLGCVSGGLYIHKGETAYEKLSIKRMAARGAGKVIRASILYGTPQELFPDVTWDTWINTRAGIGGFKAVQYSWIRQYSKRPTTRDWYRSGRLTYHFGYNPLLVIGKTILARFRALSFLRGYWNARRKKWKLPDDEVRKFFGWGYLKRFRKLETES